MTELAWEMSNYELHLLIDAPDQLRGVVGPDNVGVQRAPSPTSGGSPFG